ncbi:unannotated protein [freshwater metagenome]|uniref:Unannotated protein n=1 Tax=freshwater metagenome TaxID=449393 RepID=A0A6J7SIS3_9ZZZZ
MTKSQGASFACAIAAESGAASNGQPKAMMPTSVVAMMANAERFPMRTAGLT